MSVIVDASCVEPVGGFVEAWISFLIYGAIGGLVGMGAGAVARHQESQLSSLSRLSECSINMYKWLLHLIAVVKARKASF